MDPLAPGGASAATRDILRPVLPALFKLNERLRPEPDLAAAWPGPQDIRFDPFSVTLRLRAASWSDGEPISAGDVRFSLDKLRAGPTGYRYRFLRAVDVTDARTLTLRFDRPVRRWWSLFSVDDMVLPAHAYSPDWAGGPTLSGGPFAFGAATEGLSVRLVRNERYWGRRPALAGIDVVFVQDDETRFQLLERGEIDAFFSEGEVNMGRRAAARGSLRTDGPLDEDHQASGAWGPSWWELVLGSGLAERTRKAVVRALDPSLVAEIFEDSAAPMNGIPATFPVAPGMVPGPWAGRGRLDEARGFLAGAKASFEVGFPTGAAGAIGTFMQFRLREVGVTPELVGLDPDIFERDLDSDDRRPVLIRLRRGADAPDGASYASFSAEPGAAAVDDDVSRAETNVDRTRLGSGPVGLAPAPWQRGQDLLAQAATVAPLARVRTWIVGRSGVEGPHPLGDASGPFWNSAAWRVTKPR